MRNNFKRALLVALTVVFTFGAVAAYGQDSFRSEVSGLFGTVDNGIDVTTLGVTGELFFEPVRTANHPYREAAFLERIGSGILTLQNIDIDNVGDGPLFGIGVNYARPGFPFVFRADYQRSDIDFDTGGSEKDDEFRLRAGNYFSDGLLAGVEYDSLKSDPDMGNEVTTTGYGLFAKYVGPMIGQTVGLDGAIGTEKHETGDTSADNLKIAVSGDYYFTRAISAGLGLGVNSGDDEATEGTTWTVRGDYFFTPRYSVRVSYAMFSNDNAGFEDENTLDAVVAARF